MTGKLWWLSFCNPGRPAGEQFLGVAIVRGVKTWEQELRGGYRELDAELGGYQYTHGYIPIGEVIERGLLKLDWGGGR